MTTPDYAAALPPLGPDASAAATILADHITNGLDMPPAIPGQPPAKIHLPGFQTTGMPPQMKQGVTNAATAIAHAIIHTLTQAGYPPTRQTTP